MIVLELLLVGFFGVICFCSFASVRLLKRVLEILNTGGGTHES